jgi:hypothetical protein
MRLMDGSEGLPRVAHALPSSGFFLVPAAVKISLPTKLGSGQPFVDATSYQLNAYPYENAFVH